MRDLIFLKGLSTNLDSHSLVNGQILFTEDTNELYIDFLSPEDGELIRKPIQDKEVAELLQQHIENLNKVENKSSEDIRNELTYENVITALGYIPSIGEGSSFAAESIIYDNTESGLNGENVQAALDEVVEKNAVNQVKIEYIESELENLSPNSVVNTAAGEGIHLIDSAAEGKLAEFGMYGKAKQNTTTGKNLIPYPYDEASGTTTENITYTVENGVVIANGTATGLSFFNMQGRLDTNTPFELKAGKYILNGCPSGGSSTKYELRISKSDDTMVVNDVGSGSLFELTEDTIIGVTIMIREGVKAENLTFKPMIRLASITDDTYEPYTGGQPSPSPEYPQEIEVSGENYNLLPYPYVDTTKEVNGITFIDNKDGTITANGTVTEVTDFNFYRDTTFKKGKYIFSKGNNDTVCTLNVNRYKDDTYHSTIATTVNREVEFELTEDDVTNYTIRIYIRYSPNKVVENLIFKPMIRKASVKNDRYMPYGKGSVEVKSCGKNLYDISKTTPFASTSLMDVKNNSIRVYNTSPDTFIGTKYLLDSTEIKVGKTYTFSADVKYTSGSGRLVLRSKDGVIKLGTAIIKSSGAYRFKFEMQEEGDYLSLFCTGSTAELGDVTYSNIQLEEGEVIPEYEPYKEILSTIPTPNGLAGIPVNSGGNYTDSNGQQWICDEIVKYADGSGEYIQRVDNLILNGTEEWALHGTTTGDNLTRFALDLKVLDIAQPLKDATGCSINTHFIRKKGNAGEWGTFYSNDAWLVIHDNSKEIGSIDNFKNFLVECLAEGNPVTIFYAINPITTSLTAEQLAEIEKLSTFYPVTNMSNDFDCGMQVTYFKNSLDGEFISNVYGSSSSRVEGTKLIL